MAEPAGCEALRAGGAARSAPFLLLLPPLLLASSLGRWPGAQGRERRGSPAPELSELRSRILGVEELLEEFRLQLQRQGEGERPAAGEEEEGEEDSSGAAAAPCGRGRFSLAPDSIIRAKDSLAAGAAFLQAPAAVSGWRQCLGACCAEPRCSVAVLQRQPPPRPGQGWGCYLFDCGGGGGNVCSFSPHAGYRSYSLRPAAANSSRPQPDNDEPPHSKAGQDVVLQLPADWVVLDGRESLDDHGIIRYEWALVQGDPSMDMKVSQPGTLQLSHLQEGTYTFQLTVTDSAGQRSSDNITVTVLSVKHTGAGCPGDCSRYQFTCDDGCCIDITFACDRVVQCPDGSDEAFCQSFSPGRKTVVHVAEGTAQQRTMEWIKDADKDSLAGNTRKTTAPNQLLLPLDAVTQSVVQELKEEINAHLPDKETSGTTSEDKIKNDIVSKMTQEGGGGHPVPEKEEAEPVLVLLHCMPGLSNLYFPIEFTIK
ncbi:low-density lipoprotein receptor-related protein 11 isoform X2 [Rhinatrema bivittatum]|uniref:low-density lipoprotein receptor-related protein 11 isoform X2 n=1 Tax=Rhinatrema bivittatum TaxID=194408 RepID=UPI00112B6C22|nr:low-density lipoprotein receptor-related protein 11 isoform X2 [Rhinatrema bivittatum]